MTAETATVFLALASALVWSLTNVLLARALTQMGPFAVAQAVNLGNALFLGAFGLWGFDFARFRWEAFAWFACVGALNLGIGRWVFYTGLKLMGPPRQMTIASLVPIPSLFFPSACWASGRERSSWPGRSSSWPGWSR